MFNLLNIDPVAQLYISKPEMNYLYGLSGFVQTNDYKQWSKGRDPHSNALAYYDMVKERNYTTRLEF